MVHVVRRLGVGGHAGHRDDDSTGADQRRRRLQGEEGAAEIDLEDLLPLLDGNLAEGRNHVVAGAQNHGVKAADLGRQRLSAGSRRLGSIQLQWYDPGAASVAAHAARGLLSTVCACR